MKLNCWSLAISWISRDGPWANPSRQPVMPVRLAEPVDDEDVLVPLGGRGERAVVAEGPVDLVADQQDAALAAELRQRFHLIGVARPRRWGCSG